MCQACQTLAEMELPAPCELCEAEAWAEVRQMAASLMGD